MIGTLVRTTRNDAIYDVDITRLLRLAAQYPPTAFEFFCRNYSVSIVRLRAILKTIKPNKRVRRLLSYSEANVYCNERWLATDSDLRTVRRF